MTAPLLPPVPEITAEELRREMEAGHPVTIVDVRRQADWLEWSVPGSVNTGGMAGLAAYQPAPGARVVTVCGHGNTSRRAAAELHHRGVDARSLKGGMQGWSLAWNVAQVPGVTGATIVQVRRTGKGCLSYLVLSGSEAAVIDPSVDPQVYADLARARHAKIVAVLDTHVHADHLSRGRSLADLTGATYYLPEQDRAKFPVQTLKDGDAVKIGAASITALRTPGHTFESTCYQVGNALMTGDTLFLDSVGRPDLKAGTEQETRTRARLLHESLVRVGKLPGATIVLPCHTSRPVAFDQQALAASLDTVRAHTKELLSLTAEAFVDRLVARIAEPPANHAEIVRLNELGALPDDPSQLEAGANRCAVG